MKPFSLLVQERCTIDSLIKVDDREQQDVVSRKEFMLFWSIEGLKMLMPRTSQRRFNWWEEVLNCWVGELLNRVHFRSIRDVLTHYHALRSKTGFLEPKRSFFHFLRLEVKMFNGVFLRWNPFTSFPFERLTLFNLQSHCFVHSWYASKWTFVMTYSPRRSWYHDFAQIEHVFLSLILFLFL